MNKFQNTVKWLKIVEEKPYFFVIYFGDPIFDVAINKAYKLLDEKMKSVYPDYLKNEDDEICFLIRANKKAEVLLLNYTSKFSIRVREQA